MHSDFWFLTSMDPPFWTLGINTLSEIFWNIFKSLEKLYQSFLCLQKSIVYYTHESVVYILIDAV